MDTVYSFIQKLWRLRARPQSTLIEVWVSKDALLTNYCAFKNAYGLPVAPVLKSNAYGHGLVEVATILQIEQPPFFVVDSVYEARVLRARGSTIPILIVGYVSPDSVATNKLRDVAFTVTSLEMLRLMCEANVSALVHIKIDTGMRRQGLLPEEMDEAIQLLAQSNLAVEGVCSHFADADGQDSIFTDMQIACWNKAVAVWKAAFPDLQWWHIGATAGAAYTQHVDANLVRLGTGLYGFPRHASQTFTLMPALSLWSTLTGSKTLKQAERVGYNGTFAAPHDIQVATVALGYYEGVDRRLSNKGFMQVGGVLCPIVGRVSMNITTIDVSGCPDAALGTRVLVFSANPADKNSLHNLALLCDTTPLELLVGIPQHLRRVVV
jgi:alanine racemase